MTFCKSYINYVYGIRITLLPSTAFAISASLNLITIRLYMHFSLKQLLQNYVFSSIVAHRDYIIYYFIMESCQAEPNKKVLDNEPADNDLTTEMSSDEEQSSWMFLRHI
ncbi:unnamed protein product [Callosobruchus maculatus]|uniref:Uncharacterized protein n=1 Tax=Callosobruchus maculatus TaxID=64391 RepID=A0A653DMJ8_CALMS|nr:unnamed protein product [Callosobruchus maculatus]